MHSLFCNAASPVTETYNHIYISSDVNYIVQSHMHSWKQYAINIRLINDVRDVILMSLSSVYVLVNRCM